MYIWELKGNLVNMLEYIISLAKKHTDEIGFIPRVRVEEYVNAGQVFLATENLATILEGSKQPEDGREIK